MFRPKKKIKKKTKYLLRELNNKTRQRDQGIYPDRNIMYVEDAFHAEDGRHNSVKSDDCVTESFLHMAPDPATEYTDELLEFWYNIKDMVT
jgi:hypothetical protein